MMTDKKNYLSRANEILCANAKEPVVRPAPADGGVVRFRYKNWRGETAWRRAKLAFIYWGASEWHPEPQYLVRGIDVDKGEVRDFALRDMSFPDSEQITVPADDLSDRESLTPAQCRAARALLDWTQHQLAEAAVVGLGTVKGFEGGRLVQANTVVRIRQAFERVWVKFVPGGVVLVGDAYAKHGITTDMITGAERKATERLDRLHRSEGFREAMEKMVKGGDGAP